MNQLKLIIGSKDQGVECVQFSSDESDADAKFILIQELVSFSEGRPENICQSSCGNMIVLQYDKLLKIFDMTTMESKIFHGKYKAIDLSPQGKFIVTGTSQSVKKENLEVFDSVCLKLVLSLQEKFFAGQENWPLLSWTSDGKYFVHRVKSGFTVYNLQSADVLYKIQLDGVLQATIPSNPLIGGAGNGFLVALFVREMRGKPAKLLMSKITEDGDLCVLSYKSLYRVQEAEIIWNSKSSHVLMKASCAQDISGKSYYGETSLWLFDSSGCVPVDCKDGGIKDFAWSPKGNEFVTITGTMPSRITLHNLKGESVFILGELHRNFCDFNRFGRFLSLGGFGNLPGDLDFWDFSNKVPIRIGGNIANCPVYNEWSPCGRFFLCASTFPRRRVDNCIEVFTYYGAKVLTKKFDQLLFVRWQKSNGIYRDRARSNEIKEQVLVETRKKYIPPGLRGKVAATNIVTLSGEGASSKLLMRNRETGPSKSQIRNQKRRAKKQQQKLQEAVKELNTKKIASNTISKLNSQDKSIRKLTKQLKAILALEEKQTSGVSLNESQVSKIAKKRDIEKKLAELQS